MQIDAILFDKDGTLFDFAATWEAFACSFLMNVTNGDRARAAKLGDMMDFDFENRQFLPGSILIAGTPSEVAEAMAAGLPNMAHDDIVDLLNQEAAQAPQAEAVPLAPFLDGLRARGLKLGVATNDAEAPALAHLTRAGVHDRFDFIAGFDSGHGAKPGPGQLLAFAAWVGVKPERVMMVGDSTHDLLAGRAAGMRTAAVLTGMALADELAPHADVVLDHIGDIPAWLGH